MRLRAIRQDPGGPRAVAVVALALALGMLTTGCAIGSDTGGAPEAEPRVDFANLADGDVVTSPVNVCLEAFNVEIVPSGELQEGTGHHHVLVDLTEAERESFTTPGNAIPKDVDPRFVHLGDGSACKEIALEPGSRTLLAVVADGGHVTLDPPVSREITIEVAGADGG